MLKYREDLDNPPLLVVCDFLRFEVHTNFTNTRPLIYKFALDDLMQRGPIPGSDLSALDILRAVFSEPDKLKPGAFEIRVTEDAAKKFIDLKNNLAARGAHSEEIARFLMRILFCLFADSVALLPDNLFRKMIETDRQQRTAREFTRKLANLFQAMAEPGDYYGPYRIRHFNGGLFSDNAVLDLEPEDLSILGEAAKLDWSRIEPAIFGTLFERILDDGKRAQLGAHYTCREDILLILEPVVMAPLRQRWNAVKAGAEEIAATMQTASSNSRAKLRSQLEDKVLGWMEELSQVRILDPACGSGNFLYVALLLLLDLWKEAQIFAVDRHLPTFLPCKVHPSQLCGIETNVYAHELASVVVWIGYLQWQRENRPEDTTEPILRVLHNIEHRDAILELDAAGNPKLDAEGNPIEPSWPEADFIVSNPPFLGGKLLRRNLGDVYVDSLLKLYHDRVPAEADLVTYWFEKARAMVECKQVRAAGLVATQGIRGGVNREVLKRIAETGSIFMAWSDRPWVNEGAAVHISIVGFGDGENAECILNGAAVEKIHADLTSGVDTTVATKLTENEGLCFRADEKGGPFDIEADDASRMLSAPTNVNGRSNSDVLRGWVNADDITGRPRGKWIIDFFGLEESEAARYELPFETLRQRIAAEQDSLDEEKRVARPRARWWLHRRPGSEMRAAIAELTRYIATITTGKYRLFVWLDHSVLPDHQLYVFARSDDYFFGVLHSRAHEVWARAQGTQLREVESGFRYTPTSTFETFPFPWPPGREPENSQQVEAIAEAARELVRQRDNWLNPPNAAPEDLAKLTLTNLYNKRPKWLENAHRKLDEAVFAAYGWPAALTDAELLERLLALNRERTAARGV